MKHASQRKASPAKDWTTRLAPDEIMEVTDSGMTPERTRRQKAIERAGDACERCGWLAWSVPRQEELQLRDREGEPDRPHILCPDCTAKYDAKAAKRRVAR